MRSDVESQHVANLIVACGSKCTGAVVRSADLGDLVLNDKQPHFMGQSMAVGWYDCLLFQLKCSGQNKRDGSFGQDVWVRIPRKSRF